ncbi:tetratricopeptide repeat protein [Polyangium fumosum]|uniref:Tetratricopeptide repeat protein n=1 Tax=Polyangium fumosum TaxID=889272 RepID=A0A4U1IZM8_9BACT|nr:tetratricopeptide repeat protein [Polyangium fumosum]TKD00185.1 tetratricopeptide repeat protein [Polyangium fumosum]
MVRPSSDGATGSEGLRAPEEAERERAERELAPPFARPYLGHFAEFRATLAMQEGFVLAPVEVPSMDVGRELVASFERAGMKVARVVVTPGQGIAFARDLLSVPVSDVDVVVVLGPRDVTDDIRDGLNGLNLQRDTLAARLGKTLVWCGLRTFLNATWEEAPDFWSIRDLTFRIPLLGTHDMQRASSTMMVGSEVVDREETPRLIEAARKVGDDRNLGRLLLRHANELLWQGNPRGAEACLAEGAAILGGLPSFHGSYEEALCEELRGDVDVWLHNPREGMAAFGRALAMYQALERAADCGRILWKRARASDDVETSLQDLEQALVSFDQTEDRLGQANVLYARGDLRRVKDDLDDALLDFERALKLYLLVDDRLGQANVLKARGDLRRVKDDLDGALLDYERALELYLLVDSRLGQANVLQAHGDVEIVRDEPAAALPHYQAALALYEALDNAFGLSSVLAAIAGAHALLGQPTEALVAITRALPLAERTQNRYALDLATAVLSDLSSSP